MVGGKELKLELELHGSANDWSKEQLNETFDYNQESTMLTDRRKLTSVKVNSE
jgi:hypothetical protein